MSIFNKPHVMFDLETLSQHQNAAIVSIGACKFTFENGITDKFLMNVSPKSCKEFGLHFQASTIEWWKQQPAEIRAMWQKDPQPLDHALKEFNDFVGRDKNQFIWANGSVFDCGILTSAFISCNIEKNWKYWQEMDARTLFNFVGVRNDQIRKAEGGYHSALGDAISQTETLMGLFGGDEA